MGSEVKIYVCTKGKKCPKKGGKEVAAALVEAAAKADPKGEVVIKECKCLDLCKRGPAVVVMPDKAKYGRVKPSDAAEIVSTHQEKKGPIKRLLAKKKE